MTITTNTLKGLEPREKLYRFSCGGGLLLEVAPTGSKLWRYRFRHNGGESMLAIGSFPETSLKRARELRDEQAELLESGHNPAEVRRKQEAKASGAHTFKAVATTYFDAKAKQTRVAAEDSRSRFENWVFPKIGTKDIGEIEFADVLALLRKIEKAGRGETARRVRADIGRVFRFAMASGLVKSDPTPLPEALVGREITPYPNPPLKKVAAILRAIDHYDGHAVTKIALQLLPRLLCRPGELRKLRWSDVRKDHIELDASDTKQGAKHIIPLSTQSRALLDELYELTEHSKYCFPTLTSAHRCMSDNTLNMALRRMGFTADEVVAHSFRKVGSTALHEQGYESQWIERQLGHTDRDKIRATYNHAQHLDSRRQMMQQWSDFLDELKEKSETD
jgi:integrase